MLLLSLRQLQRRFIIDRGSLQKESEAKRYQLCKKGEKWVY